MNNENLDEEEVLNTSSDVDTETTDEGDVDDVEELRARLEKAERDYNNQKIRAEKAEAEAKARRNEKSEAPKQGNLSAFDLVAIAKADIDEDTLNEVQDYAKWKKISVSEALKSSAIKAIIEEKAENKRIAEATNTGTARRGSQKASDESLLANARAGKMPETDADIQRLLELRRKSK